MARDGHSFAKFNNIGLDPGGNPLSTATCTWHGRPEARAFRLLSVRRSPRRGCCING
jgi:hypothetical protein